MPEPHTSTLVAGAVVGGSIGLTGTFFGAQADALVVGMLAAVFVSAWLHQINSVGRAAAAVCLSSLLAGYGSPTAASILAGMLPADQPSDGLRMLAAVAIGTAAPGVVPLLLTRARGIAQGDAK